MLSLATVASAGIAARVGYGCAAAAGRGSDGHGDWSCRSRAAIGRGLAAAAALGGMPGADAIEQADAIAVAAAGVAGIAAGRGGAEATGRGRDPPGGADATGRGRDRPGGDVPAQGG
jgi:hypothetical protein